MGAGGGVFFLLSPALTIKIPKINMHKIQAGSRSFFIFLFFMFTDMFFKIKSKLQKIDKPAPYLCNN
jgi:hypothetical protein